MEEKCANKMFITTSDILNEINGTLDKLMATTTTTDQVDSKVSPRFELQKRLADGSTVKADAQDIAAADMESKFRQAAKEIEDLIPSQRLQWAELQRLAGNKLYTQKEYQEAMDVYLTCLIVKSDDTQFLEQVYLPVMNNLALCALQMKWYAKAQAFCTMAIDEPNVPHRSDLISKLYFRRGKARRLGGDYAGSTLDLIKAAEMIPEHMEAEHRSIKKELHLTERSLLEGRRNQLKQELAMKQFFEVSSSNPSSTNLVRPVAALYGNTQRGYSTLRAKKEVQKVMEERSISERISYWQYYIAVIGSMAQRLLDMLGDEDDNFHGTRLDEKED